MSKFIASIDIGLYHLGLSITQVSEEYELEEIIHVEMVNITRCSRRKTCELDHTSTASDQIAHFLQDWSPYLDLVDEILLERQPPQGLVAIEQLLFFVYRSKAVLVHPRKVHTHIGSGSFDYEGRKKIAERVAELYLTGSAREIYDFYYRKHDMADSICMMLWWIHKQRMVCAIKKRMDATGLERFRYVKALD